MAKHNDDFRGGNYAEYLVQFALSTIGFVAPIPRQEDFFLSDLFVHLHAPDHTGNKPGYVPMGQSLTVQVKSNDKAIMLNESETTMVVDRVAIPWFIAVRPRGDDTIKLYSTIDRHLLRGQSPASCKLTFRERSETTTGTGEHSEIRIGPPIITVSLSDLLENEADDSDVRKHLWAAVGTWAWADALNIGLCAKRIPLFTRPQGVSSGEIVLPEHLEPVVLDAAPKIAALAGAVGEVAITLQVVLARHTVGPEQAEWLTGLVDLLNELISEIKAKF